MAQFKKEEVRQAILAAARREFMEHGFMGANMRSIATRADQNLGNVYNYFKNKDALFQAVLEKTLKSLDEATQFIKNWRPTTEQPTYTLEEERMTLHITIDYVVNNREDVTLLAFKSQGSTLELLPEMLAEEMTNLFEMIMKEVVKFNDEFRYVPTRFFINNLIRYFMNNLLDMIRQSSSKERMLELSEEFLIFYYNGLLALLRGE